MKNYYIPISIVIAGLLVSGTVIYTSSQKAGMPETKKQKEETKTEISISEKDHIRGNQEAKVTIVEYSDFQCPYCRGFHPTVKQILTDYPEEVRWVYKHFPLDSIHVQARPAAEASECVFEQKGNEGFWQFSDGLFENQSRLGEDLYKELASGLSLNMSQFEECVSSRKFKDKVEADYQEGIKVGVRGTPGNFVNGESVPGAVSYQTLKAAVEKALSNL